MPCSNPCTRALEIGSRLRTKDVGRLEYQPRPIVKISPEPENPWRYRPSVWPAGTRVCAGAASPGMSSVLKYFGPGTQIGQALVPQNPF